MSSRNFLQKFYIFPLNCIIAVCIVASANGQFEQSDIVFPVSSLKRQRSFEILNSSAVTTNSVIELSRAAEAFSLEYFQVKSLI